MFVFDSGYIFGISNASGVPTPVKFGSMQSVQAKIGLEYTYSNLQTWTKFAASLKSLSLNFVAKTGQINSLLGNQLLFGQENSTGSNLLARDVAGIVPASGPYTITPTVPSGGTFSQDLGVQYTSTGIPLQFTSGSPTTGQYSLSGGVYTFSGGDASQALTFNFLYSSIGGYSLVLANQFQQLAPYFSVVLNTLYDGQQVTWQLNRCLSKQLTIATLVNEMSIPEFEFEAFADQTQPLGTIGTFSYSN